MNSSGRKILRTIAHSAPTVMGDSKMLCRAWAVHARLPARRPRPGPCRRKSMNAAKKHTPKMVERISSVPPPRALTMKPALRVTLMNEKLVPCRHNKGGEDGGGQVRTVIEAVDQVAVAWRRGFFGGGHGGLRARRRAGSENGGAGCQNRPTTAKEPPKTATYRRGANTSATLRRLACSWLAWINCSRSSGVTS